MKDLTNPRLIWLKGVLFVAIACVSATLLWVEMPTAKTAVLLIVTIWAACRAYYFAFYVLERYVDPEFRFAGLGSLLCYLLKHRKGKSREP